MNRRGLFFGNRGGTGPGFGFSWRVGLLCLIGLLPLSARAASGGPAPSVRLGSCGALTLPATTNPLLAPRIGREGDRLCPADVGLGCRFVVSGTPKGAPVTVEVRLSRPALVGSGQALDRWFLLARRGEPVVAEHVFARPGQPVPGDWTLKLLIGGRLAAERHFVVESGACPMPPAPLAVDPLARAEPSMVPAGAVRNETPTAVPGAASPPPAPPVAPRTAVSPSKAVVPPPARPAPKASSPVPPARPSVPAKARVVRTVAPRGGAPAPSGSGRQAPPAVTRPRAASVPAAPSGRDQPQGSAPSGSFALQTGVFAEARNARSQAVRLRGRGFPACVVEENGPTGTRYRVLAGRFGDRRAAVRLRSEVEAIVGGRTMPKPLTPETLARLRCE